MKASLTHLQLNVADFAKASPFYKDLLGYFDYKMISEGKGYVGMSNGTVDFWIMDVPADRANNAFHRKNPGVNHFAFKVSSKEDVDRFVEEFLKPRSIATLYETPKVFPEYTPDYYAVFFESPDRMKLEIVFHS
jgi:glyoxylase I family protein